MLTIILRDPASRLVCHVLVLVSHGFLDHAVKVLQDLENSSNVPVSHLRVQHGCKTGAGVAELLLEA